jgi:hypothetical protein
MYKLLKKTTHFSDNTITEVVCGVCKEENGILISFPLNPDNTDYQAYLKWLAEGNTPLPAENE